MYDMLEQNMDQPLTALSKIQMFKKLEVFLIKILLKIQENILRQESL